MRQPRLFISCSRADRPFATKLADYLRRAYDEVWFDEHRYGGEVWWDEILWNIRACDLFIYLVSQDGIRAAYCQAEYAEAVRLRKQILPIVIRPVPVVPSVLQPLRPLDMTKGINTANVGEALSALKQLENRLLQTPQPPVTSDPTRMPLVDEEPPRRLRWQWVLLPVVGLVVLLLWGAPRLFTAPPTATPTGTRYVPTPTSALPPVTVILITLPPLLQTTPTANPTTKVPTATASARPSLTRTATPTWTPTITPTPPTSTSTVPPTVTRRVTATRAR